MKSIELTKEHKAKLLEMCKVLFPGYTGWSWDANYPLTLQYFSNNIVKRSHWFEFCITHLWIKIFPDKKGMMFGKPCTMSNSIQHYNYLIHWLAGYDENYFGKKVNLKTYYPVDYLYKEFKKLKK